MSADTELSDADSMPDGVSDADTDPDTDGDIDDCLAVIAASAVPAGCRATKLVGC